MQTALETMNGSRRWNRTFLFAVAFAAVGAMTRESAVARAETHACGLVPRPKFDLTRFDHVYFDRLRSRVLAAGERGFYVSIMLFEGHALRFSQPPWRWDGHPFNKRNNLNAVDGDPNGDSTGLEVHTLQVPAITALQEAYVRKVIDTVNDLDNVLYEITNETGPHSTEWQYHFIRLVHDCEKTKPKQHPVGMTFQYQGGTNAALLASPADWISPNPKADNGFDYQSNPPPADGRQVILSDTDHLWGIGGDVPWVWKSFLRGLNPLFMDPYQREILNRGSEDQWEPVRRALGDTRRFAERVNLVTMIPRLELASTRYCLANPGVEYLIYQPRSGDAFSVELKAGTYRYEWLNTANSVTAGDGRIVTAGGNQEFKAPFDKDAVLYLDSPLEFGPEDSGTEKAPVVYAAAVGEKVVLSGGRRLENGRWGEVNGRKAWVVDIAEVKAGTWRFRQLFVNGERRPRTRLPKQGEYRIESLPGYTGDFLRSPTKQFVYAPGDIVPTWRNLRDVEIVGITRWLDNRLPIARVDPEHRTVTFDRTSLFAPVETSERPSVYWVENNIYLWTRSMATSGCGRAPPPSGSASSRGMCRRSGRGRSPWWEREGWSSPDKPGNRRRQIRKGLIRGNWDRFSDAFRSHLASH